MQGKILSAAHGLILGDDGNRYAFTTDEWQGEDVAPAVGMRVDFEVRGSDAVDIFPIPDAASPPSGAPEAPSAEPAPAPRTVSYAPPPQPAPPADIQEIKQEIRNVEDRLAARLAVRIDRTERQMTSRFDRTRGVNVVGVVISFGELFGIFFKAIPAYILAVLAWLALIGVSLGLLAALVYAAVSS